VKNSLHFIATRTAGMRCLPDSVLKKQPQAPALRASSTNDGNSCSGVKITRAFWLKFENLSRNLQSVNFRHHEIHDNDVRMKAAGQRHRGVAILCFSANFPPRDSFENVAQKNSHRRVIIRDKNS
jgi:hypothetical protein